MSSISWVVGSDNPCPPLSVNTATNIFTICHKLRFIIYRLIWTPPWLAIYACIIYWFDYKNLILLFYWYPGSQFLFLSVCLCLAVSLSLPINVYTNLLLLYFYFIYYCLSVLLFVYCPSLWLFFLSSIALNLHRYFYLLIALLYFLSILLLLYLIL